MEFATALRGQFTAQRLAQIAICIQFVAAVRSLAEVYRLASLEGASFTFAIASPYIAGGILALSFTWAAVLLYFAGRKRLVLAAAGLMVVVLIAYKALAIGLA